MKNFKMFVWAMALSMISSGIFAMEYKPKVYILNNNTPSRVGASIGIKAIINGNTENPPYVAAGQEEVIGLLGDIKTLDLVPSSGGTGKLSGLGKMTTYPMTDNLKTASNLKDKDLVIVVDNNSYSGYWNINFQVRKPSVAESGAMGDTAGMSERLQNHMKLFNEKTKMNVEIMWAADKTPNQIFRKKLEEYAQAFDQKEFDAEAYGTNLEYLLKKFKETYQI